MTKYYGPFYTLEEACIKLNLMRSELIHSIREQNIIAVIYSHRKPLLNTTRVSNTNWIGHAVVDYRGHLLVHPKMIFTLLDNEECQIAPGLAQVLEPDKINKISTTYPYSIKPPLGLLASWNNENVSKDSVFKGYVTTLPKQLPSSKKLADQLMAVATGKSNDTSLPKADTLNFAHSKGYSIDSIRIPASEISKMLNPTKPIAELKQRPRDTATLNHRLRYQPIIERLLRDDLNISAKEGWLILLADHEADTRKYDIDDVIVEFTLDEFMWRTKNGKEKTIQSDYFNTPFGRIKKRIKEES